MRIIVKIEKIVGTLINFCRWISSLLVFGMMLLILYAVIARGFNAPFVGDYELVQIMMLTIIALSLPYVQKIDAHISIELLKNRLSDRVKLWFEVFALAVVVVVTLLVSYVFFEYALEDFNETKSTSELLRIPFFPFQVTVAFSFFLWSIQSLIMIIRKISGTAINNDVDSIEKNL